MDRFQVSRYAEAYLRDHPEIELVTFKRIPETKAQPVYHRRPGSESQGRIASTCTLVQQIIRETLPDVDEDLQEKLFQRLHDEVTTKFRSALESVLEQKYQMLESIDRILSMAEHARSVGRTLNEEAMQRKREERTTTHTLHVTVDEQEDEDELT